MTNPYKMNPVPPEENPVHIIRDYDRRFAEWWADVVDALGTDPTPEQYKYADPYGAFDSGTLPKSFADEVR